MDHDAKAENWSRRTNRTPGCICPSWRYNPRYPKPTDPRCEQHGTNQAAN